MQAQKSKLKLICSSADEAFLSRGYHKWRKYKERFLKHQPSDCHTDFKDQLKLKTGNKDVEEMKNKNLITEKLTNVSNQISKYRSNPPDLPKLFCNFIEIRLWHGCSSVNLLGVFRTSFFFVRISLEGCLWKYTVFKWTRIAFRGNNEDSNFDQYQS